MEYLEDTISANPSLACEIHEVKQSVTDNQGLAMVKGSPFKELFNYHLLKLKQSGIFSKLSRHVKLTRFVLDMCIGLAHP